MFFFFFFLFSFHWFSFRLSIFHFIFYFFKKLLISFHFLWFLKISFSFLALNFWLACNLHRHIVRFIFIFSGRTISGLHDRSGFSAREFQTKFYARFLLYFYIFQIFFRFIFLVHFTARFFSSSLAATVHPPTLSPSIGSSLLVASPDVAEFERLRSRLNESQTQTRYLQSMVNIRDQELDRARKVSCHVFLFSFLNVLSVRGYETKQHRSWRDRREHMPGHLIKECSIFIYNPHHI